MERSAEVERKFEADESVRWSFDPVATVGVERTYHLRATYFDTPDLDLVRRGCSLRRRAGGGDEGWHLKLPRADGPGRDEFRSPLADELPDDLRVLVNGVVQTAPVVPVAQVDTTRHESVLSVDGVPVALFAADEVRAGSLGELSWREFEIELLPDADPGLLEALSRPLIRSGVRPAGHASKVARALGVPSGVTLPDPEATALTADASAADVLLAYLQRQVGMLQAMKPGLRSTDPEAVHKSRVATRRLRSLLHTYADAIVPGRVEALEGELRWWAGELGAARDSDVSYEAFAVLFSELGEAAPARLRQAFLGALADTQRAARRSMSIALDSGRARRLRADLVALLVDPPFTPGAASPARTVLRDSLDRAVDTVRRRWARAEREPDRLDRWHAVRKAAKAARYGAEVLGLTGDTEALAAAEAHEVVTEALGRVQDSVDGREVVEHVRSVLGAEPLWDLLDDVQADQAAAGLAEARDGLARALEEPDKDDLRSAAVGSGPHPIN